MKTLQLVLLVILFTLASCTQDKTTTHHTKKTDSGKHFTAEAKDVTSSSTINGFTNGNVTNAPQGGVAYNTNGWDANNIQTYHSSYSTTNGYIAQTIEPASNERYGKTVENDFISTEKNAVSTFSIDADGASYSNIRRFIMEDRRLPPKEAVRTEELINYFDLDYPFNSKEDPIALNGEVSACPWNKDNKLVRIGIKGQPLNTKKRKPANFVFLIDVSGSMSGYDRLELLKRGFAQYVRAMNEEDRIAIVTYAGYSELALPSTSGRNKDKIFDAINGLGAGGSTAGADGINTAYEVAKKHFIKGGNNRIILGTDGDFNVGISDHSTLVRLIEAKRKLGIYLTVLGVGRGNLHDHTMEQLANKGNGTYEYIDNVNQLNKVFIYNSSKFATVAKDVKVQVNFNPENVKSYRLIGYENRLLNEEDFEDDTKDAGEIGANQNITALYEIVPARNKQFDVPTFTIDFRYKQPDSDISSPMKMEIFDREKSFDLASEQMKFVSCVASFAMILQDSAHKGSSSYDKILTTLQKLKLEDDYGFKKEFVALVENAKRI